MINIVIFFYIFVGLVGVCVGSFLNCVVYRLESGKSLKGRSFCPHCKHTLVWTDLFPVFSFLFLGGKCRYCKKKISWQYPLVELATGVIFLLIFLVSLRTSPQASVAIQGMCAKPLDCFVAPLLAMTFLFYVTSALIIVFIYDLKHYIIPDKVLFPAIGIVAVYRIFENLVILNWALNSNFKFQISNFTSLFGYLLAAVIASGFFLAIFLVTRGRGMGFGDVKLAVLMGLLLGLPNVLAALFLAFFFGAIIGVILMIFGKKSAGWRMKSEIPFGPFLIAGTFIAMLWGEQLIGWYLRLFLI